MKKSLIVVVLVVLTAPFAKAQYMENAVKFNVFGLAGNQLQLSYERALGERFSAQLSGGILGRSFTGTSEGQKDWEANRNGFIVVPEVRYYLEEGLKGAYVAGFFRYRQSDWDVKVYEEKGRLDYTYTYTRSAIGGGVVVGYQLYIAEGLHVDFFLGPQFKSVESKDKFSNENDAQNADDLNINFGRIDRTGAGLRMGINLGYAF